MILDACPSIFKYTNTSDMQDKYPGWQYQRLFDLMSEQHNLILTTSEMDEILAASAEVIVILDAEQEQISQPQIPANDETI